MTPSPGDTVALAEAASIAEATALLVTLFELGREVTAVLDLDELLGKIPILLARLAEFDAFAVYLVDEKRDELRVAYATGYPDELKATLRLRVGEGLVGAVVANGEAIVVADVEHDPRYIRVLPDMRSAIVVPLKRKRRTIGAMALLSRHAARFTTRHEAVLRQFGAHVAVAIENARLFETERGYSASLETLAEIGREVSSILELDQLLERIAVLAGRVIEYRTFGILLLNEATRELEMRLAIRYGDKTTIPRVRLGTGIVGHAALLKQPVLVPDVSRDARYIPVVPDCRSELAIPLLVKDRCVGVMDLESPELDAFDKQDVEVLTTLAGQAAVAIENARLYERLRENEERLERELEFAQRVQVALLPIELPKRLRGVDVAARFAPARELGGDLYDFLSPEANSLVVAVGDVSGKGVPAALYSVFVGELIRSRTFRRRYAPEGFTPAGVLASMNTILHERRLDGYFCALCYAYFDLKRRTVTVANSGLSYPVHSTRKGIAPIELPGVPLGALPAQSYDQITMELQPGDLFVFCSDGVFEAFNQQEEEFGTERLLALVQAHRERPATAIVDEIVAAVEAFRGPMPQSDDVTAVAVKLAG